jgi:hypothetical protein
MEEAIENVVLNTGIEISDEGSGDIFSTCSQERRLQRTLHPNRSTVQQTQLTKDLRARSS